MALQSFQLHIESHNIQYWSSRKKIMGFLLIKNYFPLGLFFAIRLLMNNGYLKAMISILCIWKCKNVALLLPLNRFLEKMPSCCCQLVWQKWTNQISIFLFHTSINLFCSWHTIIRNKLMHISLFFMNVCQLRNKFMLVTEN